jgi:hypothetical protein
MFLNLNFFIKSFCLGYRNLLFTEELGESSQHLLASGRKDVKVPLHQKGTGKNEKKVSIGTARKNMPIGVVPKNKQQQGKGHHAR